MWFLIKFIVAAVAFWHRTTAKPFEKVKGGVQYADNKLIRVWRHTHKGTTHWTQFAVELKIPIVFKLTREKWYDRFFKFVGTAVEIQAGDAAFDQLIYIASDHPDFAREIQLDQRSRQLIMEIFSEDCQFISCDGRTLYVRYKGEKAEIPSLLVRIVKLEKRFADAGSHSRGLFSDPFVKRALIIEALIWSFACYAFTGLVEWYWDKQSIHIDQSALLSAGLKAGGLLGAALLAVVLLLLSGSSRSHRLLIESILVICLSLPFGGIHLVSDLNRGLDTSQVIVVNVQVREVTERVHRGRRGSRWYSYHIYIEKTDSTEFVLPSSLEINYKVYRNTAANSVVPIELSRGFLKLAWIKSVNRVEY